MRSFEETRQIAEDNLSDMERQLARLTRTYNKYMKHGAVNAAAEVMTQIEDAKCEIEGEEQMYKLAFYW